MSAPFAALVERVNRSVADRLANAVLAFTGGPQVRVLFARQEVPQESPMGLRRDLRMVRWEAQAPAEDFAGADLERDAEVTIDGVEYVVTEVSRDESGWVTVVLRRAG